jgi:gliding motility-associated-like protein
LSINNPSLVTYQWQRLLSTGWSAVPYANNNTLQVAYSNANKYRLLATDNLGNSHISNELDLVQLPVPAIPIITPSKAVTQICQGDSIILSTTFQSGYSYFWSLDNTLITPLQVVKITAKKAGEYILKVTDQSLLGNGCSSFSLPYKLDYTTIVTVTIDSLPPFCGLTTPPKNLTASPSGGTFKGTGITDRTLGTFNPATAGVGKHEITYEVSQNGSCPSVFEKRTFTVSDPKSVITTNTGKTQFCQGDIATLSAPAGMKKYEWFLAGNSVGSLNKLDVTAGGDFQLKITDDAPCSNTSPIVKIEFFNATSVTTDPIASVCGTEHPAVALKGTPSGGAFTIDGQFATTFDYKKLGIGSHKVLYKLDGSLPCLQGSSEQDVVIQDFPKPNLGDDILLGKGNGITLKGFVSGRNITYAWSPSNNLDDATIANPVASPTVTTKYSVIATTNLGCEGKDTVNIVVYQPVYIPSAFTPNGDLNNDTWELNGLEVYPNPEVQIFNRWGNIIFYSKGSYTPFDGTDKGKNLPEGMYVYKINPFPDRPDFQYKGTFMLFR